MFAAGPLVFTLLLCTLSFTAQQAIAQDTPPPPNAFQRQFERIDFALSGVGVVTTSVSGIEQRDAGVPTFIGNSPATSNTLLKIAPSTTAGELITLRYIAKPLLGFEFNYSNARFTQNYAFTTTTTTNAPPITTVVSYPGLLAGGAQNSAHEISLGYIAHLHKFYGIAPYAGAGFGTFHFIPTPGGGQGLHFQYRAVYYYTAGLDYTFPESHFGMRLAFRQLIYLAPDFGENYLTITRRAITTEPSIGFFLRF
jgi:hypothetical protein